MFPPQNIFALNQRGIAKAILKNNRGAIDDYTKAIEIYPEFADAYYDRGNAKLRIGQKDSGCLDLSKAGELGHEKAYDAIKAWCQ